MSIPLKDFRVGITDDIEDALESVATAFGKDKARVAREVLAEWAAKKKHEHTVWASRRARHGAEAALDGTAAADDGVTRRGRK